MGGEGRGKRKGGRGREGERRGRDRKGRGGKGRVWPPLRKFLDPVCNMVSYRM